MSEEKHYPWKEGQPTRPDVDALLKAFPPETLVPGWRATDEALKAVIPQGDATRYHTVCEAWRKRLMQERNINVFRERNVGYYVPTPEEVFAKTPPTLQHISRTAKKQMRRVAVAPVKTDLQRSVQDHQGRLLHSLQREAKKAKANVLPSTTVVAPPSLEPPRKSS